MRWNFLICSRNNVSPFSEVTLANAEAPFFHFLLESTLYHTARYDRDLIRHSRGSARGPSHVKVSLLSTRALRGSHHLTAAEGGPGSCDARDDGVGDSERAGGKAQDCDVDGNYLVGLSPKGRGHELSLSRARVCHTCQSCCEGAEHAWRWTSLSSCLQ